MQFDTLSFLRGRQEQVDVKCKLKLWLCLWAILRLVNFRWWEELERGGTHLLGMVKIAFKHCLKKQRWENVLSKWIGPTIKNTPEAWTKMDGLRTKLCHSADYLTCLGSHMVKILLLSIRPIHFSWSIWPEWTIQWSSKSSVGDNCIDPHFFNMAFLSACLNLRNMWIRAESFKAVSIKQAFLLEN